MLDKVNHFTTSNEIRIERDIGAYGRTQAIQASSADAIHSNACAMRCQYPIETCISCYRKDLGVFKGKWLVPPNGEKKPRAFTFCNQNARLTAPTRIPGLPCFSPRYRIRAKLTRKGR